MCCADLQAKIREAKLASTEWVYKIWANVYGVDADEATEAQLQDLDVMQTRAREIAVKEVTKAQLQEVLDAIDEALKCE